MMPPLSVLQLVTGRQMLICFAIGLVVGTALFFAEVCL